MTEILSKQSSNRAGLEAPALLFVTGSLLAVTIILSRLATAQGAQCFGSWPWSWAVPASCC